MLIGSSTWTALQSWICKLRLSNRCPNARLDPSAGLSTLVGGCLVRVDIRSFVVAPVRPSWTGLQAILSCLLQQVAYQDAFCLAFCLCCAPVLAPLAVVGLQRVLVAVAVRGPCHPPCRVLTRQVTSANAGNTWHYAACRLLPQNDTDLQ